jgi:hypothetical protein
VLAAKYGVPGVLVWTIHDATGQRTLAVDAAIRPSMVEGATAKAVAGIPTLDEAVRVAGCRLRK